MVVQTLAKLPAELAGWRYHGGVAAVDAGRVDVLEHESYGMAIAVTDAVDLHLPCVVEELGDYDGVAL